MIEVYISIYMYYSKNIWSDSLTRTVSYRILSFSTYSFAQVSMLMTSIFLLKFSVTAKLLKQGRTRKLLLQSLSELEFYNKNGKMIFLIIKTQ